MSSLRSDRGCHRLADCLESLPSPSAPGFLCSLLFYTDQKRFASEALKVKMPNPKRFDRPRLNVCLASAIVGLQMLGSAIANDPLTEATNNGKHVLGPTAVVEEVESEFSFSARVDTGATTSSLHVEDSKVADEADNMDENVGKTIRFRIKNQCGATEWLERKIAEISVIKTSERKETRYKVPVTLECEGVKKRVLVSLNDRSHMAYPVLLGRNFLQGDFVVDVALGKGHKNQAPCKSEAGDSKSQKK